MRYAVVLFHLAGGLFAADLPYFTDPVNATYFADLSTRSKASLVPGTLEDCTTKSTKTATNWECKLKGAAFKVAFNGADIVYPLDTVRAVEFTFDVKAPSSFTYYFSGPLKERLADGTELATTIRVYFDRYMERPTFAHGKFDVGGFGVGGQLFFKFK